MAIFIAALSKRGIADLLHGVDFSPYLPFEPASRDAAAMGATSMRLFGFGAALDRPIHRSDGGALVLQGYGDGSLEARLLSRIFDAGSICTDDHPEAFCCVAIEGDRIAAYTSATGVDQIFALETDDAVYLTNRHNLLGPFLSDVSFNKTSFKWMAGRTHIGDFGTYWNEVTRIKPGYKQQYRKGGSASIPPKSGLTFAPVSEDECVAAIDALADDFARVFSTIRADKRIWLSGGKDSRAILGLLDYAGLLDTVSITTGGELFSPDVMAATDLVHVVGATKRHIVSRPGLSAAGMNFADRIAKDLAADFTGGSLADLKGLNRTNLLIIGGHENGFKLKANTAELEKYIEGRRYWVDNQNILRAEDRLALFEEYSRSLRETLKEAPVRRYGQVDLAHFRNQTFLPSAFNGSHVAASEIHPFLDGRLYKLLCGISDEALNGQLIHYLMMRKSPHAIECVPFAADGWPAGLQSMSARVGLPFRGNAPRPYQFNPAFPSQRSFGMYDWRLDLVSACRAFTETYLRDNRSFFDFLDEGVLESLLRKDATELKFSEMYTVLGLYKMALVHMCGTGALRFSELAGISAQVAGTLNCSASSRTSTDSQSVDVLLKEKLHEYERCISVLVKQSREGAQADAGGSNQALDATINWILESARGDGDLGTKMEQVANVAGYTYLDASGAQVGRFQNVDVRGRIRLSADVIMDHTAANTLLVAFRSDIPGLVPKGFVKSAQGFYFRYINPPAYSSTVSISVEFPPDAQTNQHGFVSLELVPWYAKAPIFVRFPTAAH